MVGPYRVIDKIGQGGMGAVYRAENTRTGLVVVLKILLRQHTRDKELVWRFFNEAKTASQLDHDNIVDVYDAGRLDDGTAYIAMEYLPGETLGDLLDKRETLSIELGAYVCWCMAKALESAHGEGIIHRDLKPDNIHLVPDAQAPHGLRVKLLDFGIAKLMWDNASSERTATGVMLGTPAYMAPEQCRSLRSIDGRADLYALGCILYEVLTGTPPFVAEGAGEILAAHITQHPARLRKRLPEIPRALEELGLALLAKDPADRPATAGAVATALLPFANLGQRGSQRAPKRSAQRPAQRVTSPHQQPNRQANESNAAATGGARDPNVDSAAMTAIHDDATRQEGAAPRGPAHAATQRVRNAATALFAAATTLSPKQKVLAALVVFAMGICLGYWVLAVDHLRGAPQIPSLGR